MNSSKGIKLITALCRETEILQLFHQYCPVLSNCRLDCRQEQRLVVHNQLIMGAKGTKISYFDGSYYQGEVNSLGREHGKGQIFYAKGDTLQGTFNDGDCTYAIINKKNGDSYEGNMRDHKYHGQGKLVTKNYQQIGLFRDNRFIHGKITYYPDGSSYQGSIENGSKAGKGIYMTKDGTRYQGYFQNDKFEGEGQLASKDGTIYKGQFKQGVYHGKGNLKRKVNGHLKLEYEGDFVEGIFHGNGKLTISDSKDVYEGSFVQGKKHGHGQYRFGNKDIYNGRYNNDVREDENCTIQFASGSTYRGGIKNNLFHGRGILTRSNGDYFEGYFEEGKMNGRGKLKAGEVICEGEFKDDKKHGRCRIVYNNEDNEVFEGNFQNDLKEGEGVLQGRSQLLKATYKQGMKNGPYLKKIGSDYEEKGEYQQNQLNGIIQIKKGDFSGRYRYKMGEKVEDLPA